MSGCADVNYIWFIWRFHEGIAAEKP